MLQKFIYDIVHGNIELSYLESLLLKNPIINRLHQILQNSTAYTVYPNLKSSRFEHSLGTMNYAGKIFQYGLINSIYSSEYLKEKEEIITNLINENEKSLYSYLPGEGDLKLRYKKLLKEIFSLNGKHPYSKILKSKNFLKYVNKLIGNSFQKRNLFIVDVKYEVVNKLLNQSVRIFGLLHDIGHLPLSHLFEFALANIFEYLSKKREREDLNSLEKNYFEKIKFLMQTDDKGQIHEQIGENVTKYIFQGLKFTIIENNDFSEEEKATFVFIIFIIEQILKEIIKGSKSKFYSIYSIVSGTIDADRLDFVQRDGFLSGIAKCSGNTDRLIRMFCLGKSPLPKNNDRFLFMPSIQSQNDIEELLNNRFKVYKFVVNHHAVKRSDYIFQKLIELKLIKELEQGEELPDDLKVDRLLYAIDIAYDLSQKEIAIGSFKEIVVKYIQLTDFWLLSTLNNEYIKACEMIPNKRGLYDYLLIEVYENRRKFKSLWKRSHDYQKFLFLLGFNFIEKIKLDQNSLSNKLNKKMSNAKIIDNITLYYDKCIKIKKEYNSNRLNIESLRKEFLKANNKRKGELQVIIKQKVEKDLIYKNYFIQLGNNLILYMNLLKEIPWTKKISDKLSTENLTVLISLAKLKSGIKDLYLVDNKDQQNVFLFNQFSPQKKSIDEEINLFSRFFVFYFDLNQEKTHEEILNILVHEICYFINEEYIN